MTGISLAYSIVKLGAVGENDDCFWHDGGTRSTSIPLDFGRNFRPVPPQVSSAKTRIHCFAPLPFPHQFHKSRWIALALNHNPAIEMTLCATGNQFAKLRALPHHKLFVLSVSPVLARGAPPNNSSAAQERKRSFLDAPRARGRGGVIFAAGGAIFSRLPLLLSSTSTNRTGGIECAGL